MMKVAIFKTLGEHIYPKNILKEINGKSFLEIRTDVLVNYIESLESLENFDDLFEKLETMKVNDEFRYGNSLYYKTDWYYSRIEIVTVDTSSPWTISNKDGAEYIEYSKPMIIDKATNYYTFEDDRIC